MATALHSTQQLLTRTSVAMDTYITVGVIHGQYAVNTTALTRALDWFQRVEAACSRFDSNSELRRLLDRVGEPVPLSPLLYQTLAFALATAAATDGRFDPTIGQRQEQRGFVHNYRTGAATPAALAASATPATFRDLTLDPVRQTVTLHRPLVLDLGAVAKGFAIDLAMQELLAYPGSMVEAGGDLRVQGHNPSGGRWQIGIRHPRLPDALLTTLPVSNAAVCTSGDYERRTQDATAEHHLLDPQTGHSPNALASVTVVAPTALAADTLSTAAFILGPTAGLAFLEQQGVAGLLVTPAGTEYATPNLERTVQ